MPDGPRPPAQRPGAGSGKRFGGVSRTWWIVGGVATVGIVYYAVHKQRAATAATDPNNIDPSLATDGGSSGIPSGAGQALGVTPSDPFTSIPTGSTVTYTAPDGSTTTVQEPSATTTVPSGSTTSGGSSGGIDSTGGTTTTTTDSTTTQVAPAPVIAPPQPAPVPINPALAWQNTAETWFAAHHYNSHTVRDALTRYQLGEGLDHTHLGIVETAIHHFGALVGAPTVHLLPAPPRPRPVVRTTGRQRPHH